jgi:NhaA family Na+:H+ antiporter
VPAALKLFLLTLAVTDDLGAVGVIAVVYSGSIHLGWLATAVATLVVVHLLRRVRVWSFPLYVVAGVVAWYLMLRSGVHATVAGVALGFLTPMAPLRPELDAEDVVGELEDRSDLSAADVRRAAFLIRESVPVGERLADRLHPWSSFLVVPVFALANAGVPLTGEAVRSAAGSRVSWGIGLGLVVGKTLGVLGMSWLAVKVGLARRPRGATRLHMLGIAMATGIGFTVAFFVTGLAFDDPVVVDQAKIAVLAASLVAAVGAVAVLRLAAARASAAELALEADENADLFTGRQPERPARP